MLNASDWTLTRSPHATCHLEGFCVDQYCGLVAESCRTRRLQQLDINFDAHQTCAAAGFCVDYYTGHVGKPCRSAGS